MSKETATASAGPGLRQRALSGDRKAFVQLMEDHLDGLYRFVAREIGYHQSLDELEPGEVTIEGIVSETALLALEELARLPRGASFRGWLRHLALEILRRRVRQSRERRRYEEVPLEEGLPLLSSDEQLFAYYQPDAVLTWEDALPDAHAVLPEEIPVIGESWAGLEAVLNHLPSDERKVFVLHAMEGLSLHEIAAMRAQRLDRVEGLYSHARETLRAQLADRMDD